MFQISQGLQQLFNIDYNVVPTRKIQSLNTSHKYMYKYTSLNKPIKSLNLPCMKGITHRDPKAFLKLQTLNMVFILKNMFIL